MPITIPNVSVPRSAQNLGGSLLGLSGRLAKLGQRQKKLEIENENAAKMRIMLADLQTFDQNYAQQRNVQNTKYTTPGEQYVGGEGAAFESDWYNYSLASGETVTGAGDDIIADYGDKLWQEKFAGQFSSQESENRFRRTYDAQIAASSGAFRTKNFNYRQQNAAEQIGRELNAIESNPRGLTIEESMKSIRETTDKAFRGGLITEQQRHDQNAASEYVLLTGETSTISQGIARETGGAAGVEEARQYINGVEGLNQDTKDDIFANMENEHNIKLKQEKQNHEQRVLTDSKALEQQIANGEITTVNKLEAMIAPVTYDLLYSGTQEKFPNSEFNFLKGLIDETKEPEDDDKFDTGNIELYREQMFQIFNSNGTNADVVRMLQGGTDLALETDYENGISNTEQGKLRKEMKAYAENIYALATDAGFQAVVEDSVQALGDDATERDKQLLRDELTYYASSINGSSGSTSNATPEMIKQHADNYLAAESLKAVSELTIDNFLTDAPAYWRGKIDDTEAYYKLSEEGRLSYDQDLAREALKLMYTEPEIRAAFVDKYGTDLTEPQEAQLNNVLRAVEVTNLTKNQYTEDFGKAPASITLDNGIPYLVDDNGNTFKLDYKEEDKSLDYQYMKPVLEKTAEPKRTEFDTANPQMKAGRVSYGSDGTDQLYVEGLNPEGTASINWFTKRGSEWIAVPNIEDLIWTDWNEDEKKYLNRMNALNRQYRIESTSEPYSFFTQ